MKKILFVLAAGIVMMSCNEADKTADASNNEASTNSAVTSVQSNAPNTSNVQTLPIDTSQITTIEWLDGTTRDFGKIKEGEKLNVTFRLKNTGIRPLVISAVNAGCGCTVAEKPSKPIAPGASDVIKAAFDSQGRSGSQSKYVDVVANTDPQMTRLIFNVEVKPKS